MSESSFIREARAVSDRINAISAPDSLILPIVTDPHLCNASDNNAKELFAAMEALSSVLEADGVLHLGDSLDMLGREFHASNEEIKKHITDILDRLSFAWSCPVYAVNGNHDGIGTDFFEQEFWYSIIGTKYDKATARRPGHEGYFYADFPKAETRIVFLSLPSGSDIEAEMPINFWKYGDEQLRWLAETALDTPYRVLLAAHVPMYYESNSDSDGTLGVWTGTRVVEYPIAGLCGWVEDRDLTETILRAYTEHREINIPSLGLAIPARSYTGGLVACLSGHMHSDDIWLPGEERTGNRARKGSRNPLPCAQAVICSSSASMMRNMTDRHDLSIQLDIAVLTPSKRRLTLVRYGGENDRTIPWPDITR